MAIIESDRYREARKALQADPIVQAMANDLREMDNRPPMAHEDGTPRFEFQLAALGEYKNRGGQVEAAGIGDVAKALLALLAE